MPSFLSVAVPALALAGNAFANPLLPRGDACLAAVTGKAALGDEKLRKEHCSSFIKTIVTPEAKTVTVTITGAPAAEATGWENYKRDVTVCPNEVPNYASACDEAHYKSACKAFGISGETTFTIPATTTTKSVYVSKGGDCSSATSTATVTKTEAAATVTVTSSPTGNFPGSKCITKEKADFFVNGFIDLLQYTSYNGTQAPPGRGYHYNTSAAILDTNFVDYSDSINFMANFPLGTVTFGSKAAFDYGQGILQPELKVETLNTWYGCNTIAWRWHATTPSQANVRGINNFVISADGEKIIENYAEFDNAEWLRSFGLCSAPPKSS